MNIFVLLQKTSLNVKNRRLIYKILILYQIYRIFSMNSKLETIIGFVVVVIAIGFAILTYKVSEIQSYQGASYKISAKFDQIEGILAGSDVKISGITVGVVTNVTLDPESYGAVVIMSIKNKIKIPSDSSAQIATEGLLKNKYVAIFAGGSQEALKSGDEIKFTQSSISLENLIGKFLYNFSQK